MPPRAGGDECSGRRRPLAYTLAGLVLWAAVLKSGLHATLAGVALAFFIPARTRIDPEHFIASVRDLINHFEHSCLPGVHILTNEEQQAALHGMEEAAEDVQLPLHRMEHALHTWVSFLVMPVFALANAGVAVRGDAASGIGGSVTLGVISGLLLGKPAGILLASWVAVRLGIAELPASVTWSGIHGAAWLGGIGFTMSLFVAGLAFTDESLLASAKAGILMASAIAGATGYLLLSRGSARRAGGSDT